MQAIDFRIRRRTCTLAFAMAIAVSGLAHAAEPVTLTHVHGLSYSADGQQLLIPSHHGLAVFEGGKWRKAVGPAHDYMGFAATRDSLYSSGHPAPDSGLTNPFGLIRSGDGGKTWQSLGLQGESDFHIVATGYATNTVYVVNPAKNSRMPTRGIYRTRNDGLQWTLSQARGLTGEVRALAVHPQDGNLVAAGTDSGLYLSRNAGNDFERLYGGSQVVGLAFDLDGKSLWYGSYAGKATLTRSTIDPNAKADVLPIPTLQQDAVAYIAQNPARRNEIAIATFKRHVFVSKDAGRNWTAIATDGTTGK